MKTPKTTQQMIADAKAWGVEVVITTKPEGTGEIPLPGLRGERSSDGNKPA